nr:SPOR domain-containing protein [Paracoccus sp. C2R09]
MIPAGARYVQVGIFADDASADASLRRIAGRGHPTAQIRPSGDEGPRIILAGPFGERAALVAALADLRVGGFAGAVAR